MFAVFDIGGTKTRVGVSTDLTTVDSVEKFDTSFRYREGMERILRTIETLAPKGVTAIAGCIRGPLNHERTGIVSEIKLTDWVGRTILGDIAAHFSVPVFLENDSALAGLGEATRGAGKGYPIVAYHTVSTGVGGARYIHGVLDMVSIGFEPGHQILDIDRTVLGKPITPTLENLVSGTALEKRRGVKPYEIDQSDHVWDELAEYLAAGLKNTIVYWSPSIIVLGGSMIVGDPRIPLASIKTATERVLEGLLPCPPIVDAALKDDAGLHGALTLLANKLGNK